MGPQTRERSAGRRSSLNWTLHGHRFHWARVPGMSYRPCQCPLFLHVLGAPQLPQEVQTQLHQDVTGTRTPHGMENRPHVWKSWPHTELAPLALLSTGTAHGAQRLQIHLRLGIREAVPRGWGRFQGRWGQVCLRALAAGCSVCGKIIELYFDDRCTFLHGYYILINGLKSSSSKRLHQSWKER